MKSLDQTIRSIISEEVSMMEIRLREDLQTSVSRDLNFTEACGYLQMSSYTLRQLCRMKRIPFRTVGTPGSKNPRYIFNTLSLDRWKREEEEKNYLRSESL